MSTGKEFIESIKKGEYQHQSLDIQLHLTAPVFLIPESVFRPAGPCLVVDTGAISLKSHLVRYTKGLDYKLVSDPSSLYDQYQIGLTNF